MDRLGRGHELDPDEQRVVHETFHNSVVCFRGHNYVRITALTCIFQLFFSGSSAWSAQEISIGILQIGDRRYILNR